MALSVCLIGIFCNYCRIYSVDYGSTALHACAVDTKFITARRRLSKNVRLLRLKTGLSQERLALEAGVDRTYVSQIERNTGNPSLLVLSKLATVLKVDIGELLALHPTSRR